MNHLISALTLFDYIVIGIIFASIIISLLRGFVQELISLCGWIIAFILANAYAMQLAELLPESIHGTIVRIIIAFAALLIGVRILAGLVGILIQTIIKASGMTLADRGLGGLFGFMRGVLLVIVAALLCGMTAIPQQAFWQHAVLKPLVETTAKTVIPFLPGDIAKRVKF